ncbi:MAG: lamin tail domain-containing protein, partial [Acidobacteriota bacterium]
MFTLPLSRGRYASVRHFLAVTPAYLLGLIVPNGSPFTHAKHSRAHRKAVPVRRKFYAASSVVLLIVFAVAQHYISSLVPSAEALSSTVVISQVYGGGGNSGATFRNDFIELFNRGTTPQSLNGWAVQYASATGTTWAVTNLTNVTLQPGQYYLVQEAAGTGGTTNLPTPDAIGTIALAAAAGKVALTNT